MPVRACCDNGSYVIGEDGYGLSVAWRGADTFFCVGKSDAFLIENGMEVPAEVEFLKNGFVRVGLTGLPVPFNLNMRNAQSLMAKFAVYVTRGGEDIGRALYVEPCR